MLKFVQYHQYDLIWQFFREYIQQAKRYRAARGAVGAFQACDSVYGIACWRDCVQIHSVIWEIY